MDSAISADIYYRQLIAKPKMELILLCLCKFVKVLMEKGYIFVNVILFFESL